MRISSRPLLLILGSIIALLAIISEPSSPGAQQEHQTSAPSFLPSSENRLRDSLENLKNIFHSSEGNVDTAKLPDGVVLKDIEAVNKNGDIFVKKTTAFEIFYFREFDSFLLSIYGRPFEVARQQAEQAFLATVAGGSKIKACRYNVVISAPAFAHPDRAGREEHLSFCKK